MVTLDLIMLIIANTYMIHILFKCEFVMKSMYSACYVVYKVILHVKKSLIILNLNVLTRMFLPYIIFVFACIYEEVRL